MGVRDASVSELSTTESNVVKRGVGHAPFVDVAAVGQLHWGLFTALVLLDVLVAAIQKCCHWVFLDEIQVPITRVGGMAWKPGPRSFIDLLDDITCPHLVGAAFEAQVLWGASHATAFTDGGVAGGADGVLRRCTLIIKKSKKTSETTHY